MSSQALIFLSYSHKDQVFADELLKFLKPFEGSGDFQVWSDRNISPGSKWNEEIENAVHQADVAILLISADYLASPWLAKHELPLLFERHHRDDLRILPVVVRPAAWVHTPLAYFQVWPRDGRPIAELSREEREHLWIDFAKVLVAAVHRLREPAARSLGEAIKRSPEVEELGATEVAGEIATRTFVEFPKVKGERRAGLFFISHAQ